MVVLSRIASELFTDCDVDRPRGGGGKEVIQYRGGAQRDVQHARGINAFDADWLDWRR